MRSDADRDPPVHPRLGARRVGPAARRGPGRRRGLRRARADPRRYRAGDDRGPRSAATWPTSCRAAGRCWSCGPTRWPRSCRRRSAPSWSPPGGSRPRCSAETRDGNLVGVGDLIQARRNDYTLRVHGGRPVTNREVYEVIGRNRLTGTLTVRDRDGILAHLPAAYVQQHTTLAYAVTSYGAQGQTVYSSHSLVDQGTTRAGVYVPGTRGTRRQHLLRHLPARPRPPRPRADRPHTGGGADRHPHPPRRPQHRRRDRPPRRGGRDPLAGLGRHPVGPADRRVRPPPRHRHPHPAASRRRRRASGRRARLRPADGPGAVHGAGRTRPARGARRSRRARQPARRELGFRRAALPHPDARQRRPRSRAGGARRRLDHLRRTVGRPGRPVRPGARRGRDRPPDRARRPRRREPAGVGARRAGPRPGPDRPAAARRVGAPRRHRRGLPRPARHPRHAAVHR